MITITISHDDHDRKGSSKINENFYFKQNYASRSFNSYSPNPDLFYKYA